MAANVSTELTERFARDAGSDRREPVILTLERGTGRERLEDAGLEITFVSRDGRIVAGSVDAAALQRVTALAGVLTIEPDEEATALS